jgi:hypothetical protein
VFITGTREEPGTSTQGAPVFPGSSRLGIEPKTPGCLVQDPTTRQIGDLIPTIGGSSGRGHVAEHSAAAEVCVFFTAGPMIRLCEGGRGTVKGMCYDLGLRT